MHWELRVFVPGPPALLIPLIMHNMGESQQHYAGSKQPGTKDYTSDVILMQEIYNWPPTGISWGTKKWASGWLLTAVSIS